VSSESCDLGYSLSRAINSNHLFFGLIFAKVFTEFSFGENIMNVRERSFDFALHIINYCNNLHHKNGFYRPIMNQLLRSGTSIGANIEEAEAAYTKKDFLSKMYIAFKEARETNYWIRLLLAQKLGHTKELQLLLSESITIIKLLTSITKNTKRNLGI